MKNLLFLVLVFVSFALYSQNYVVKDLMGVVKIEDRIVQKKDVLSGDAELLFTSEKDYLYVMQLSTRSHYYLSARGEKSSRGNEFLIALRNSLIPPAKFIKTGVRPAIAAGEAFVLEDLAGLKRFFRGRVLSIDGGYFPVNADNFPQDEQHFFQLEFSIGIEKKVVPLSYEEEQLLLGPGLIQLAGLDLQAGRLDNVRLVYTDTAKGSEREIGRFELHFVPSPVILEKLNVLRDAFPDVSLLDFAYEYAFPFLENTYGKINPDAVIKLLEDLKE